MDSIYLFTSLSMVFLGEFSRIPISTFQKLLLFTRLKLIIIIYPQNGVNDENENPFGSRCDEVFLVKYQFNTWQFHFSNY